ncbi:MAG: ExbD/TolR family protein [bacterium]
MKLVKKKQPKANIPTSSMSDIAFLLIIFFMVSTVFRQERGLDVTLPTGDLADKLQQRRIHHIYLGWSSRNINDRLPIVSIDDQIYPMDQVDGILRNELEEYRANTSGSEEDWKQFVFSLQIEEDMPYVYIDSLLQEVRQGGRNVVQAIQINYGARESQLGG